MQGREACFANAGDKQLGATENLGRRRLVVGNPLLEEETKRFSVLAADSIFCILPQQARPSLPVTFQDRPRVDRDFVAEVLE